MFRVLLELNNVSICKLFGAVDHRDLVKNYPRQNVSGSNDMKLHFHHLTLLLALDFK